MISTGEVNSWKQINTDNDNDHHPPPTFPGPFPRPFPVPFLSLLQYSSVIYICILKSNPTIFRGEEWYYKLHVYIKHLIRGASIEKKNNMWIKWETVIPRGMFTGPRLSCCNLCCATIFKWRRSTSDRWISGFGRSCNLRPLELSQRPLPYRTRRNKMNKFNRSEKKQC